MTTPYIEAKKAEIVQGFEKFLSTDSKWQGSSRAISLLLGEYLKLDTLLDEIESRVIAEKPKFAKEMVEPGKTWWEGWMMNRAKTIEAFQHLRTGVETE